MYRAIPFVLFALAACDTANLESTCAVGDVIDQTDPSVARMLHDAEVVESGPVISSDGFDEDGNWLQVTSREHVVKLANGSQTGAEVTCTHSGCVGEYCEAKGCIPDLNELKCSGAKCLSLSDEDCNSQTPTCSKTVTRTQRNTEPSLRL